MDEDTDTEHPAASTIVNALSFVGLIAAIAAIAAPAAFGILGGAVAIGCGIASIAAALMPPESPRERYCRECNDIAAISEAQEPAISPQPAEAEGKQWAAAIEASRKASRRR